MERKKKGITAECDPQSKHTKSKQTTYPAPLASQSVFFHLVYTDSPSVGRHVLAHWQWPIFRACLWCTLASSAERERDICRICAKTSTCRLSDLWHSRQVQPLAPPRPLYPDLKIQCTNISKVRPLWARLSCSVLLFKTFRPGSVLMWSGSGVGGGGEIIIRLLHAVMLFHEVTN